MSCGLFRILGGGVEQEAGMVEISGRQSGSIGAYMDGKLVSL